MYHGDPSKEHPMSRVQLALNVADLDEAVEFYTKLFGTAPAKIRDGLRQLRHRRAAAEAGAHRGAGEPAARSTTSASRSSPPTRSPPPRPRCRPTGWPPTRRSGTRAASPCRTRCGSTDPTASRGRSTPCWPTPRRWSRSRPTAAAPPPPTPCRLAPSPPPAAADPTTEDTEYRRHRMTDDTE